MSFFANSPSTQKLIQLKFRTLPRIAFVLDLALYILFALFVSFYHLISEKTLVQSEIVIVSNTSAENGASGGGDVLQRRLLISEYLVSDGGRIEPLMSDYQETLSSFKPTNADDFTIVNTSTRMNFIMNSPIDAYVCHLIYFILLMLTGVHLR